MSTDQPQDAAAAARPNRWPWVLIAAFVGVSAWGNWVHSIGAENVYRVLPALVPISAALAWHLLVLRHFDGDTTADRFRRIVARVGAAVVFAWTMVGSWDALVQVGERGNMPHPTALPVAVDGLVFVAALAVWTARQHGVPDAEAAELRGQVDALRAELGQVRALIPKAVHVDAVRADVLAEVERMDRERPAIAAAPAGPSAEDVAGIVRAELDQRAATERQEREQHRAATVAAAESAARKAVDRIVASLPAQPAAGTGWTPRVVRPVDSTPSGPVDSGQSGGLETKADRAKLIMRGLGLGKTRAFQLADDPEKVAEARAALSTGQVDSPVDSGGAGG